MDKPVKLTGLWRKTSKGGKDYMSATVGRAALIDALNSVPGDKVTLLIFKNNKRPDHPKDPDYSLSAGEVREMGAQTAPPPADDLALPPNLDEVPF